MPGSVGPRRDRKSHTAEFHVLSIVLSASAALVADLEAHVAVGILSPGARLPRPQSFHPRPPKWQSQREQQA